MGVCPAELPENNPKSTAMMMRPYENLAGSVLDIQSARRLAR
jgi:hypothetical protein